MKTFFLVVMSGFLTVQIQAQNLTQKYFDKLPSPPGNVCVSSRAEAERFVQRISILSEELDTEIKRLKEDSDKSKIINEEIAKKNATTQMIQQYGLSEMQMQKINRENMSDEEKDELADQILQQHANMSLQEVENLSGMTDEGLKAYAEALGTEVMASQSAGHGPPTNQKTHADIYELGLQQQTLNAKISETAGKIGEAYSSVESDPELKNSFDKIQQWHNKLMSLSGVDYGQGPEMDQLSSLIKSEKVKICDKYTPLYLAALSNHFNLMKNNFADQRELASVTTELTKIQAGVILPSSEFTASELQTLKQYLNKLMEVYKYKLYYPEDDQ